MKEISALDRWVMEIFCTCDVYIERERERERTSQNNLILFFSHIVTFSLEYYFVFQNRFKLVMKQIEIDKADLIF